jgi:hypothetical protein
MRRLPMYLADRMKIVFGPETRPLCDPHFSAVDIPTSCVDVAGS